MSESFCSSAVLYGTKTSTLPKHVATRQGRHKEAGKGTYTSCSEGGDVGPTGPHPTTHTPTTDVALWYGGKMSSLKDVPTAFDPGPSLPAGGAVLRTPAAAGRSEWAPILIQSSKAFTEPPPRAPEGKNKIPCRRWPPRAALFVELVQLEPATVGGASGLGRDGATAACHSAEASMSEAYSNVVGGSLKLKGSGIKKKKKKKSSESSALTPTESSLSHAEVAADTAARAAASSSSGPADSSVPRYTDTERRRMEVLERRKHEAAAAGKIKSHREQVKEFNDCRTPCRMPRVLGVVPPGTHEGQRALCRRGVGERVRVQAEEKEAPGGRNEA
eukprot:scaffold2303_cov113-Isochrysis_galbana.AAC.1